MQANRNVDEVPVPSREFEMLRRLLARLQRLLGKAEAVDLLKISAHRRRRHVVGGLARRHPRGFVSIVLRSGSNDHGRPGATLESKRTVMTRPDS